MRLVIVESVSKAKTIQKYLNASDNNADFEVMASKGHVVDLPLKTMGINTATWEPEYTLMADKKGLMNDIAAKAKKASRIYLAADPDREGEAIAYHLHRELKRRGIPETSMVRVEFHEITQRAVVEAIQNPRGISLPLVEAQEARRILDRVVGYEASPLLWRRFAGAGAGKAAKTSAGLSAGRVQSAALNLLVERYKSYEVHDYQPYWTLKGLFQWHAMGEPLETKAIYVEPEPSSRVFAGASNDENHGLQENDNENENENETIGLIGKEIKQKKQTKQTKQENGSSKKPIRVNHVRWTEESEVQEMINHLRFQNETIWKLRFQSRESIRRPPPPFTTSTLQQEAGHRHGFSIETTMKLAQSLYEGGKITYMRTDSTTLAKTAQDAIVDWIKTNISAEAVHRRNYKTKMANAQEAHEAIRPTDPFFQPAQLEEPKWTEAHQKLYELIWRRTIASQMKDALFFIVSYTITGGESWKLTLKGSQDVLVEQGFLNILQPRMVPDLQRLSQLKTWMNAGDIDHPVEPLEWEMEADVVRPQPLYQEPTLVHRMEKEGIGRPSTYAPILKKLTTKGYVVKAPSAVVMKNLVNYQWSREDPSVKSVESLLKIGGASSLIPTSLGVRVADYLMEAIPNILEIEFTANMETQLDDISRGEMSKAVMLNTFYQPFHKTIERAFCIQAEKKKEACAVVSATEKKDSTDAPSAAKSAPAVLKTVILNGEKKIEAVQTRYGPALFIENPRQFISLTPFLEWRKKTIEDLTETDVGFLIQLPLVVETPSGRSLEIHLGRYGLYVKEQGVNCKLSPKVWDAVLDGTFTPEMIESHIFRLGTSAVDGVAGASKASKTSNTRKTRKTYKKK
jgi:DNA topoisomerase-1